MDRATAVSTAHQHFVTLCQTPSDINEHLPVLKALVMGHTGSVKTPMLRVAELGVRAVVSSWAVASGLVELARQHVPEGQSPASSSPLQWVGVDLEYHARLEDLRAVLQASHVGYTFIQGDSARVVLPPVDLLFIDTWHVYGHLRRELEAHHSRVTTYIVLHDTTVDEYVGETLRCGGDVDATVQRSGYSHVDVIVGLWPAVVDFLATHPQWVLEARLVNNNGLTVLRRASVEATPPRGASS